MSSELEAKDWHFLHSVEQLRGLQAPRVLKTPCWGARGANWMFDMLDAMRACEAVIEPVDCPA